MVPKSLRAAIQIDLMELSADRPESARRGVVVASSMFAAEEIFGRTT
jgi:hypothetical protein